MGDTSTTFADDGTSLEPEDDHRDHLGLPEIQFYDFPNYIETPVASPYMAKASEYLTSFPISLLDTMEADIKNISMENKTSPTSSASVMLSVGSQEHGKFTIDGQPVCKPCAWFHKEGGCQKSTFCSYCHLCSPEEIKNRKKQKI